MRPQRFPVIPPVDVPAAILPSWSRATAPTVPNLTSTSIAESFSVFMRSSDSRRRSVSNHSLGMFSIPCSAANVSAPSPESMTCGLSVITLRASWIGCLIPRTPAIAPASRVRPSIIDASSSISPSQVNTAPRPALNNGSSSIGSIAAWIASIAVPPSRRTLAPASSALRSASR